MDKIIKINELRKVKDILLTNVTGLDFFKKIFKSNYSNALFLETAHIFDQYTFENFKTILIELNDDAYIVTRSFLNYDMNAYSKFLSKNESLYNSEFTSTFKITSTTKFDAFDEIQKSLHYDVLDTYIISSTGKYCLYTNPSVGLTMLGFNNEVASSIREIYKNDSDVFNNIDELFEFVKNISHKEKEHLIKIDLETNFGLYFKMANSH